MFASIKAISGIWYPHKLVTFANKLHSNKAKQSATKTVAGKVGLT